jgi:hypothetical protein
MGFYVFIFMAIVAFLVYLFLNAIGDQTIALVIALLVFLYLLYRGMSKPYQ